MKTYTSPDDVKICCYAIAADEPETFIDRWLVSMSGADYICVLITKEGNSNWNYFNSMKELPEYKDKLIVAQKTITPWRFDVARNESLKLVPEDADVLVCTDIDEVLISDFWDDLRQCVFEHPNFERIFYRYAWSHDDEGNPKWVFWYDKITQSTGWKWKHPVHEALYCSTPEDFSGHYYLDASKIYLHHYPDSTKSRGTYLKLLELRAQEDPKDLYGLYYLAREYSFISDYDSALKTAFDLYTRISKNPVLDDMKMFPSVCCMLGDFSSNLGLKADAEYFYRRGIENEPTYRDCYVKLAQLLAYQNRPLEVYSVISDMNQKSIYKEDWRLTTYYWRDWKIKQILADAKCWEKKYDDAYKYFTEALEDIKTKDDIQDASREGFYNDLRFLQQKIELK